MKPSGETKRNTEKNGNKHRDYLIQQEKLRNMGQPTVANKSLNAESMIENLLSRSETFMKQKDVNDLGLPAWLQCNSHSLPQIYKNIWLSVKSKNISGTQQFCDTQFLTSFLLTSGIQTENLGFIWALCNKTVAGMLTEQELYNVLALIALAQMGRPWNNLSHLCNVEQPLIPRLNYNLLSMNPSVADCRIHSTYFPNTMAMSIPSPVQTFQNTTNTLLSNNNKVSLELNPSLLEAMLSNDLVETAESTPSITSCSTSTLNHNNVPNYDLSWNEKENDLTDNWTEFIDHTATTNTSYHSHSHSYTEPHAQPLPALPLTLPVTVTAPNLIEKDLDPFFSNVSPSVFGNNCKTLLEPKTHMSTPNDFGTSQNINQLTISADSAQNSLIDDFSHKLSTLALVPQTNLKDKIIVDNTEDDFTDFQSFESYSLDSNKTTSVKSLNPQEKIMEVSDEDALDKNLHLFPRVVAKKKECKKDLFLKSESDDTIYGNKGFVVENPLYLSDSDSIYDNNSVNSLKFDSETTQGSSLFNSNSNSNYLTHQGEKNSYNLDLEPEKLDTSSASFIQTPNVIPVSMLQDKYSVFRMLDTQHDTCAPELKNDEDDFGDFLTADTVLERNELMEKKEKLDDSSYVSLFPQQSPLELTLENNSKLNVSNTQSIQEVCVEACISVLRNAVEKFSNLNSDVLKLVLCEDKCIDYIQALIEIYRMAERMIQSIHFGAYKKNLNDAWKDLNSFVSTKLSTEECDEENDYSCSLCNTSSGSAVIKYGVSYYHIPCINFYLNCVNSNLPS